MRYTKMRKMIRQMAAGALTAFLLTGLAGCGAAGPVGEEETDEQETGSAVDVGEQGVSEANWDKTAFEINGEPAGMEFLSADEPDAMGKAISGGLWG